MSKPLVKTQGACAGFKMNKQKKEMFQLICFKWAFKLEIKIIFNSEQGIDELLCAFSMILRETGS